MGVAAPRAGHPAYRADIDGLRAVAVLAVVAFHAFPARLPGGFTGVDVFFVISGFLISGILFAEFSRGEFRFGHFYARRVRRIFPALALVLAASLAVGWVALFADEYQQLGTHVAAGAGFASNLVLWSEAGYFDNAADTKPLLHLWSLGVEEQFYLAWPLAAWLAWKARASGIALVGFVALASFALNAIGVHHDVVGAFFSPLTRLWELMAGAALAWVALRRPDWRPAPRAAATLAFAGAALLALGFAVIDRYSLFPGTWAVIPVAGTMMLVAAGPGAWVNARILAHPAVVAVGLVSYPLYLWHWPLLSFARIVEGEVPRPLVRAVAVAIAFGLAWATYVLLERPIRSGKRHGRTKVAVLAAAIAALGLAGLEVARQGGFPDRPASRSSSGDRHLGTSRADPPGIVAACLRRHGLPERVRYCMESGPDPRVALVGDSNARAMYDGLAPLLEARGKSLLVVGGTLFPGVDLYLPGDQFQMEVSRDSPRATLWSATAPGLDVVVLFSNVAPYWDYTPLRFQLADDPALKDPRAIWEIAMRRTLDAFGRGDRKVVFVLIHPILGFDPRACLVRPVEFWHRARTPCAMSRTLYDQWYGSYRETVLRVLRDYPRVTVFDSAAYLCDRDWCWAQRNGRMLYRDAAHLSPEGARQVGAGLLEVIDGAPSRMLQ